MKKKAYFIGHKGDSIKWDKLINSKLDAHCCGAAAAGHTDIVLQCVVRGALPNEGLHSAGGTWRAADIIKLHLAQPCVDINKVNRWGDTILDAALRRGHIGQEYIEIIRAAGGTCGTEL